MSHKYTYKCNKCGNTVTSDDPNLDLMCFKLVEYRPFGLYLGKFRRPVSNDTKAIRQFFHIIANYMKLIRM